MVRPRPSVIALTDRAAARVRELIAGSDKPLAGVRVGVKKGGCAGMEYTLERVETPGALDDVVTERGVTVYVDPAAVLFSSAPPWTTRRPSCARASSSRTPTKCRRAAAASRWS